MWQVVKSVLAAFFGVQKDRQRRDDFENGNPVAFIAIGLVMALILIVVVFVLATTVAG